MQRERAGESRRRPPRRLLPRRQHGWVWGNQNYRTTDGGATWEALPLLGSAYAMEFFSVNFGVTTGNFGSYVSRDGGLTWEPSPEGMTAFAFAGDLTGLGVAGTGVYRTTDGGETFALVQAGAADAVEFLSPTVAVAIVDGTLLRSADGGLTWTGGTAAEGRNALLAVAADVALAWGRSGTHPDYDDRIFRSADGGLTWTDLGEVIDPGPFAVGFAFAVPAASIVVASDGAGNLLSLGGRRPHVDADLRHPRSGPGLPGERRAGLHRPADGLFWLRPRLRRAHHRRRRELAADLERLGDGSARPRPLRQRRPDRGGRGRTGADQRRRRRAVADSRDADVAPLEAVQVVGPQEAVAVDGTGRVFRSYRRRRDLDRRPLPHRPSSALSTSISRPVSRAGSSGRVSASGALFHTTTVAPAGRRSPTSSAPTSRVDFAGASGWAASYDGTFYRTTDGGAPGRSRRFPGLTPRWPTSTSGTPASATRSAAAATRPQRQRRRELADPADAGASTTSSSTSRWSARTSSGW
jgi:photosystem II stability/assembly factor-like uncharacterized protein